MDLSLVKDMLTAVQEGEILAYGSLIGMAILAIVVGSFHSLKINMCKFITARSDFLTQDAVFLPYMALLVAFAHVICKMALSEEYSNLVLTAYFCAVGVYMLVRQLQVFTSFFLQDGIRFIRFSLGIGAWYLLKNHWIAHNILAVAIVADLIATLQVNDAITGGTLLGSLLFGDVLLHVTSSKITLSPLLELQFKLIFPKDLNAANHDAPDAEFVTLGLVEIVIPGILMALLLRFDSSRMRLSYPYFFIALGAYVCALVHTFMDDTFFFNIPLVLLPPTTLFIIPLLCQAFVNGDLKDLLTYRD